MGINTLKVQTLPVIFDAVQAVKARKADVLICDTAGRLPLEKSYG